MRAKILLCIVSFGLPTLSLGFNDFVVDTAKQHCFSKAMVGMDSVINAALGVPPEHAVELIIPNGNLRHLADPDNVDILNIILSAYSWKESPHSYALNVFYRCAQQNVVSGQSASN